MSERMMSEKHALVLRRGGPVLVFGKTRRATRNRQVIAAVRLNPLLFLAIGIFP